MMRRKTDPLPPLSYLHTFEVAARWQSFASASKELGVSESAISRKVRLLETHYGIALFERGHKSVTLTQQGTSLLERIAPAMQTLRDVSESVAGKTAVSEITLAATNSVASLWLIPKMRQFSQANNQLNIMLVASDDDAECLADSVDLSILRGNGKWPEHDATKLFGEIIFPVCAPEFLERNPSLREPVSLLDVPLIEVSSNHSEWMNWNTWLRDHLAHVPELSKRSIFNTYPYAIQAAVEGVGVALGWGHLVDHLLESGQLVRPLGDLHTRTPFGYYLLERTKSGRNAKRDIVTGWLIRESAARNTYAGSPVPG
jgi:DNA-binding transcriptional LysR family regulator